MSKYYQNLHVIYSPQDKEDLEKNLELILVLLKTEALWYILSYEAGDDHKEHNITHYDIVCHLNKQQRPDLWMNKLRRRLDIRKESIQYRYAVKVYGIESEDSLKWCVGYNRKENREFIFSKDIDDYINFSECIEYYKNKPAPYTEYKKAFRKNPEKRWTFVKIVDELVVFLKENKFKYNDYVLTKWIEQNINNIDVQQYDKLMNCKYLIGYLERHGIEQDNEYIDKQQDEVNNVLGLIRDESEQLT